MVRLTLDTYAPGPYTRFTPEAAAGMVGQRVPVVWQPTADSIFDELPERVTRMCEVIDAEVIDNGLRVRMTVEVDE